MIEELIQKFHPSLHRGVRRWLEGDCGYSMRIEMAQRYPALALAFACGVAHWRACDLWFIGAPMEKIRKASRIGIGSEIPASRLRIRLGRKYPIVYVAPEDEPEKGEA
jgi:hypothetical protein